jgi:16S rRNA (cytidine1402-2'-O)-methyltransferase
MGPMLSVISTPIGNLGDITRRAMDTLAAADAIVCEDTRVTGMLLQHLTMPKKELISFHGYSDAGKLAHILSLLEEGKHLALVSDAGTPGVSDPGFAIVSEAAKRGMKIEAIPGPSAFLAALSVSGLPIHNFLYLGFLPLKKGRKSLINSLIQEEHTIVFYESVHRIEKTLSELAEALASQPKREVVIARELTKIHEEVIRTTAQDLPSVAKTITKKGEFVVMVGAILRNQGNQRVQGYQG